MGWPIVMAAVAIGSAVMEAEAARKRGEAQKDAAFREAEQKQRQAAEILRRNDINQRLMSRDADAMVADQRTTIAAGGVDVGSGMSLLAFDDTMYKQTEKMIHAREEAKWDADNLEIGAVDSRRQGNDYAAAGAAEAQTSYIKGVVGAFTSYMNYSDSASSSGKVKGTN